MVILRVAMISVMARKTTTHEATGRANASLSELGIFALVGRPSAEFVQADIPGKKRTNEQRAAITTAFGINGAKVPYFKSLFNNLFPAHYAFRLQSCALPRLLAVRKGYVSVCSPRTTRTPTRRAPRSYS